VFRLDSPAVRFSTLICFEDTVPRLARRAVRNGARLLINQTNDAWFEDTALAEQHMSHCVFRCVENRVPAVRCANLGVSCYIGRSGVLDMMTRRLIESGEVLSTAYRVDSVTVPGDTALTFYSRYGDVPFALPCGILALGSLMLLLAKSRRNC